MVKISVPPNPSLKNVIMSSRRNIFFSEYSGTSKIVLLSNIRDLSCWLAVYELGCSNKNQKRGRCWKHEGGYFGRTVFACPVWQCFSYTVHAGLYILFTRIRQSGKNGGKLVSLVSRYFLSLFGRLEHGLEARVLFQIFIGDSFK